MQQKLSKKILKSNRNYFYTLEIKEYEFEKGVPIIKD
jgi:hypothetical protein